MEIPSEQNPVGAAEDREMENASGSIPNAATVKIETDDECSTTADDFDLADLSDFNFDPPSERNDAYDEEDDPEVILKTIAEDGRSYLEQLFSLKDKKGTISKNKTMSHIF